MRVLDCKSGGKFGVQRARGWVPAVLGPCGIARRPNVAAPNVSVQSFLALLLNPTTLGRESRCPKRSEVMIGAAGLAPHTHARSDQT